MKPALTLAVAPVSRFCVFVSFGRTVLRLTASFPFLSPPPVRLFAIAALFATSCRSELRDVKYSAEPKPVRSADGTVPRQRLDTGLGPARIERKVAPRDAAPDCCTRVLRRSAGWRRTAEEIPEPRPATKWNVGRAFLELDFNRADEGEPSDIAQW